MSSCSLYLPGLAAFQCGGRILPQHLISGPQPQSSSYSSKGNSSDGDCTRENHSSLLLVTSPAANITITYRNRCGKCVRHLRGSKLAEKVESIHGGVYARTLSPEAPPTPRFQFLLSYPLGSGTGMGTLSMCEAFRRWISTIFLQLDGRVGRGPI